MTHPVGQKKSNAWGLHDMLGNVWEWCTDWHDEYSGEVLTDPAGPSSGWYRVLRGGSWCYYEDGRAAVRWNSFPNDMLENYGFRLTRSSVP